ncbi:hypothetical protein COCMIDRAFT_106931, partial [Bipolaris oryzae ATCC 44560]
SFARFPDPETNGNNDTNTDTFHPAERSLLICPVPRVSFRPRFALSQQHPSPTWHHQAHCHTRTRTRTRPAYHASGPRCRTAVSVARYPTPSLFEHPSWMLACPCPGSRIRVCC